MRYTSRGVPGEKAAVREAQRDAAVRLEEKNSKKSPGLGEQVAFEQTTNKDTKVWCPPPQFRLSTLAASAAANRPVAGKQQVNMFSCGKADAVELKIEKCLDMAEIKKGSFFFMSVKYVEDGKDWATLHEERQSAVGTF
ncbi:hypothetical protein M426DRAFT_6694 [Hypoxylon sp. CI-4A]|nr:hypothetical protein M426DRAFT_6694 [Hypoxylon sp. CI-4A]